MGECALLVEGQGDRARANRGALALAAALADARGVLSVLPAIRSLLVRFDPLQTNAATVHQQIDALLPMLSDLPAAPRRIVRIPVRYGGEAGPDLAAVAAALGMSEQAVVAAHCATVLLVQMVGFAPGFAYIGPLPDALDLPRRDTPRTVVPAGSVAIAARLTGVYPAQLPGGWHLIGQTALPMFDMTKVPPATLQPGDGVQFVALPGGVQP